MKISSTLSIVGTTLLCLASLSCASEPEDGGQSQGEGETVGDGDGDSSGDGDGDGDPGDGDPGDGDPGDGDPGDGDGDSGPGPLDGPFNAPSAPFCGVFHFDENLGPDYDTAFAALDAEVAMTYGSYFLEVTPIEAPVYDYYNNVVERDFWVIAILDQEGGIPQQSLSDILDNEGNHYWIDWCPD